MVRVIHEVGHAGRAGHLEMVEGASARIVYEADALDGELCGETPRSHVRIVSGGS